MAIIGHFKFDCVEIFHGYPYVPETVHFAFLVLDAHLDALTYKGTHLKFKMCDISLSSLLRIGMCV